jgi:hypothetical protein
MYRDFLEEHAKQLLAVEDALDESLSDMWDIRHDPVALEVSPPNPNPSSNTRATMIA